MSTVRIELGRVETLVLPERPLRRRCDHAEVRVDTLTTESCESSQFARRLDPVTEDPCGGE